MKIQIIHHYKKSEKIIFFSFLFSFILYILRTSFDLPFDSPLRWSIQMIEFIFLNIALTGAIIFGMINIEYKKIKSFLLPLFGLVYTVFLISMHSFIASEMKSILIIADDIDALKKLQKKKNIPDSTREKFNRMYARSYYCKYGIKIKYVSQNKSILYKPTKEDIEMNKNIKITQILINNSNKMKKYWFIMLIISVGIGAVFRIKKYK